MDLRSNVVFIVIITNLKVIPSSWIVMPVSVVSLRVPILRILLWRNFGNSFTLLKDVSKVFNGVCVPLQKAFYYLFI